MEELKQKLLYFFIFTQYCSIFVFYNKQKSQYAKIVQSLVMSYSSYLEQELEAKTEGQNKVSIASNYCHRFLLKKYNNQRQFFHLKLMDKIIGIQKQDQIDQSIAISSSEKTKTVDCQFDDQYEHMTKFYSKCESIIEMAEIYQYYAYTPFFPFNLSRQHFDIMIMYKEKHMQQIYKKLKQQFKLQKSQQNRNSSIDSSQGKILQKICHVINGNKVLTNISLYSISQSTKDESYLFQKLKQNLISRFGRSSKKSMRQIDSLFTFSKKVNFQNNSIYRNSRKSSSIKFKLKNKFNFNLNLKTNRKIQTNQWGNTQSRRKYFTIQDEVTYEKRNEQIRNIYLYPNEKHEKKLKRKSRNKKANSCELIDIREKKQWMELQMQMEMEMKTKRKVKGTLRKTQSVCKQLGNARQFCRRGNTQYAQNEGISVKKSIQNFKERIRIQIKQFQKQEKCLQRIQNKLDLFENKISKGKIQSRQRQRQRQRKRQKQRQGSSLRVKKYKKIVNIKKQKYL